MTIGILAKVRLTAAARERQGDLADAVGTVHVVGDGGAQVMWPRFRGYHKIEDLELAEP